MLFLIEHTTEYAYSAPATEAFTELRLRPRDSARQTVSRYVVQLDPPVRIESHVDYFGNHVESISIPFRHDRLAVTSECAVSTRPMRDVLQGLDLTLGEARQMYQSRRRELYDFLQPSPYIPFTPELRRMAAELLPPTAPFARGVRTLNRHIFTEFKYTPGATDVSTPLPEFLEQRRGVCQDFAHLMICLLRNAGIPARYVSGYIETDPVPTNDAETSAPLIGATASHAWVELFTPNGFWVGLDPTNDIAEGERHVQIGIGRDYADVPPLRGVFKGTNAQTLSVQVRVSRDAVAVAATGDQ
jgi:transglutaminase-like putative cysteine protease